MTRHRGIVAVPSMCRRSLARGSEDVISRLGEVLLVLLNYTLKGLYRCICQRIGVIGPVINWVRCICLIVSGYSRAWEKKELTFAH